MIRSFISRSSLALACLLALPAPVVRASSIDAAQVAAQHPVLRAPHDLFATRRLLALSPGLRGNELADALDRLEAKGVHIPIAVAGAGLIVEDLPGARAALAAERGVVSIHGEPLPDEAPARSANCAEAGLLAWWNDGFRVPRVEAAAPAVLHAEICAGAKTLEEALAERARISRCSAPSGSGTVHFAAGRVAVNLMYPESVGEASLSDWLPFELASGEAELVRALGWWNLKSGGAVTFVLENRGTADTPHEAGLLAIADEEVYLAECLTSLGIPGTCAYGQLDDLNEIALADNRAHFAFTQVILHANDFNGSTALAYAYLGGPHTVALLGNGSLGQEFLDRVIAHELGHIFQALDEYSGGCGGCNDRSGYLDIRNANCVACPLQSGPCVMRGSSQYDVVDMLQMEERIHPCSYTKGMAGLQDANLNGILDVRETFPETDVVSALADTLMETRNVFVEGNAWDQPYASAPPKYSFPVTINSVANVEFSVDGRGWASASPKDGFWSSKTEPFEFRLPAIGGGTHKLLVRSMNSVLVRDPTPVQRTFFVYDLVLLDELELLQDGAALLATWRVNGEDFGSTYRLWRRAEGETSQDERLVAEIASRGVKNDRLQFRDASLEAAREYIYRLEVDIPGKGPKALGTARGTTVLAPAPDGKLVSLSPNPSSGEVLITITVARGPRDGGTRPPDEDNGGVVPPPDAGGGLRDDTNPPPLGNDHLRWRDVRLRIYDLAGRLVRDLGSTRELELSRFNRRWDGRDDAGARVAPGAYFLRTEMGETREATRLMVVR